MAIVHRSRFGPFLRQSRDMMGLSAADLAYRVGCSEAEIRAVESNLRRMHGRYLVNWANALRLTVEQVKLLWLNEEMRLMSLESGTFDLFKVVPVREAPEDLDNVGFGWGEFRSGEHSPMAPVSRS